MKKFSRILLLTLAVLMMATMAVSAADYDINNELLDTVDSADDVFTPDGNKKGKRANPASPPAADPPVPNLAHTEM